MPPFPDSTVLRDLTDANIKYLTADEERRLFERAREGDLEARDILIRSQLRWAAKLCRRYVNRGMDYEDLFQVSVLAVIRAVDKLDPDKARLGTYIFNWVRSFVGRAVIENHTVRVPHCALRDGQPLLYSQALSQFGKHDGETEFVATLAEEPEEPRPYEQAEIAALHESLDELPPRERAILWRRYHGETLLDIANDIGVTRERVRQLEMRGMERLTRIHLRRTRKLA